MSNELRVHRTEPGIFIQGQLGPVTLSGLSLSIDEAWDLRDRLDAVLLGGRICGFSWDVLGGFNGPSRRHYCTQQRGHRGLHYEGDPNAPNVAAHSNFDRP